MDIFHAERHTVESNFRIETTIDFSCVVKIPPLELPPPTVLLPGTKPGAFPERTRFKNATTATDHVHGKIGEGERTAAAVKPRQVRFGSDRTPTLPLSASAPATLFKASDSGPGPCPGTEQTRIVVPLYWL